MSLPPATFKDADFYTFEFEAIWGSEWFCIGRATDIPNAGDYYNVTVGHEPLVVVRRTESEISVLSNVCQHRGMLLTEGRGNLRRLRCPMHSWVYDLSGRLIGAPGLTDDPSFDRSTVCLPQIRSEIWQGFIFVTFNKDLPPISGRLSRLEEQLANFRLAELRAHTPLELEQYAWNWKMYSDECYHCTHLHAKSFGAMFPVPQSAVDEESEYNDLEKGIIAYNLVGTTLDAVPTRTGKALHPILPGLTEAERSRLGYITVAPNLLIVTMPDKVKYFLWLPNGPMASSFGVSWLFPQSTLDMPTFEETFKMEREDLYPVMVEDVEAWGKYQAGMLSRFAPRGHLTSHEQVMVRLQDWLIGRYRAYAGR